MRRPLLALALISLVLLATPAWASTRTAGLRDFSFTPGKLTVGKGTTVRWVNRDQTSHNVTGVRGPRRFHSKLLGHGRAYRYRFTVRGTYRIECTIHAGMHMQVRVR